MCGFMRYAFFCGLALVAGMVVMRFVAANSSYNVVPDPGYTTFTPVVTEYTPVTTQTIDQYTFNRTQSWASLLTTPVYQSTRPSTWVDPDVLPFYRVLYGIRNVVSIPIVFFGLLGLVAAYVVRRGRVRKPKPSTKAVSPETLAKARKQAAIIDRMHGIMDRIETRVERLESALLP